MKRPARPRTARPEHAPTFFKQVAVPPMIPRQMRTRILLVDDEQPVLAALQRAVREGGHEVLTASDGEHAISVLRTEEVDLCVTDLQLPGKDGFAVIEAARRHRPPVPVIVLTGHGTV